MAERHRRIIARLKRGLGTGSLPGAARVITDSTGAAHRVVEVQQSGGRFLMLADARNWLPVIRDGSWEREQRLYWEMMIDRHGSEFGVDVGANNGIYSLLMAGRPTIKRVWACEPTEPSFTLLQTAAAWNDGAPIEAVRAACSDAVGEKTMLVFPDSTPSIHQLVESQIHSAEDVGRYGGRPIEVKTLPLDDIVQVSGRRVAVKIDTEGHEIQVLEGARGLLARNDCILQIESFREDLGDSLLNSGYRLVHRIANDWYFVRSNAHSQPEERRSLG